jgi:hypothetical protein
MAMFVGVVGLRCTLGVYDAIHVSSVLAVSLALRLRCGPSGPRRAGEARLE